MSVMVKYDHDNEAVVLTLPLHDARDEVYNHPNSRLLTSMVKVCLEMNHKETNGTTTRE